MQLHRTGPLPRLAWGVMGGMFLGSAGSWLGLQHTVGFIYMVRAVATFTALFSELLSFIIPLLIIAFVTVGVAETGSKHANKRFGITLGLSYLSTVIAGFFAYFTGIAFLPEVIGQSGGKWTMDNLFVPLFSIHIDPICGVLTALLFSFVLGIGMAYSKGTSTMKGFFRDMREILTRLLSRLILPLIPFYIGGLFCRMGARGNLALVAKLFISLYACILVLQWLYILLLHIVSSIFCRQNHLRYLRNFLPVYYTAISTQSSVATVPDNLASALKNGIKRDLAEFCIPFCATSHLPGGTICLVLGSLGIMTALGKEVSLLVFAPFIFLLGIMMIAAPGVPGGGVMSSLGIIGAVLGFSEPLQQMIFFLHFSQDSFGTATNVTGDQALARMVGEVEERTKDDLEAYRIRRKAKKRLGAPQRKAG